MFKRTEPITKQKWRFEAHIGDNTSWWDYYRQYKTNVDDLVNSIESGANPIDTVSLPLLFSIRHSLELGLKANILVFEKITTISKMKLSGGASHSLEMLYSKFVAHLTEIRNSHKLDSTIETQITDYLKKFEILKDSLHSLDSGSYNFRYPVDTNGNPNFPRLARENIVTIINDFYEIQPLLLFTQDVLMDNGIPLKLS